MHRANTSPRSSLQEGWVIANHILVSFHVAFISSILVLPATAALKADVLRFVFASWETLVSALFMAISFHAGIALHELGHFITAARLNALNEPVATDARQKLDRPFFGRLGFLIGMFLRIPSGKAPGVKKEGLNYYPDAPYNLAVAAAGPRASRNVAIAALPVAAVLIAVGLFVDQAAAINIGRVFLGIGLVAFLDFRFADPGKYREFKERERLAREKASLVAEVSGWLGMCPELKRKMVRERIQEAIHPRLGPVAAPWQFRNCGMGGRHTEKEYPESNISMQEAMFLILSARDYQDAQELTVRLQNRLKEIIEKEEGCRVMGIGLEGGLAPYIEKGDFPLPEVRLWSMMKQAIAECGCQPGVDVAIALDPAMAELENAYRAEFDMPDSVGMYLFWRDKAKVVLDRDAVLEIYVKAMEEYEIPLLSIEDGFSEDDYEGWRLLLERLGDRIFVIGDDLVTTNDQTIEIASNQGLINSALIKANQIGSLYETLLAMLVALGKGLDLVVSHRSKSPNDDMEAQIALSVNSLGLKAGGGANTERLIKYQAVTELMLKVEESGGDNALRGGEKAVIRKIRGYEEPTNAGIPTVGVTLEIVLPTTGVMLKFKGATPLGTSAGTGEAIHLVDTVIEQSEHREIVSRFASFFEEVEPGVFSFAKAQSEADVRSAEDEGLAALFERAQRYGGKGCLNAVDNVLQIIAPHFEGRDAAGLSLRDIDSALLGLELSTARRRGKLGEQAGAEDRVRVMQRKQNLGMNAMLSVSLALARAVAHVQGKELYELLREEMLAIIDRLADSFQVSVHGSRFSDYVTALREVNGILEGQDRPLYEVLRDQTGIYTDVEALLASPPTREAEPVTEIAPEEGREEPEIAAALAPSEPNGRPEERGVEPTLPESFTAAEKQIISELNRKLYRSYIEQDGGTDSHELLHSYLEIKAEVAQRVGRFGIVNNRIFKQDGCLLVPYLVRDTVILQAVRKGATELVSVRRFPPGTIYTDNLFVSPADADDVVIDLEERIFFFDAGHVEDPRIARIRDIASLLKSVNESTNPNEALYLLRHLVARLCNLSVKTFLGAKNLQPEVNNLNTQLVRFINGRLSRRFPGLTRTIVRNLSSVIGKPNLIDRLWNDTIRLAEIDIRGSAIVNELRRSSHHALGRRTLLLAQAYLDYLDNGNVEELGRLGFGSPAEADIEARKREKPRRIVERVVEDLGRLLGTSETVARIQEWQESYADILLQCQFGTPIEDELETLITKGIRARNRWAYYHHLRILMQMTEDFSQPEEVTAAFKSCLETLQELRPDDEEFDADRTEQTVRKGVEEFVSGIQGAYQDELFGMLQSVLDANEKSSSFETFCQVRDLRERLQRMILAGGFTAQRYFLQQLDCLLEEMIYLALRQVATAYSETGVDLDQCLEIIRISILNLEFDGLESWELNDLAGLLSNPARTEGELLDVLGHVSRHYHKIRQRVIVPYEKMHHRLGLEEEDLRTVVANMQRYMHDLNSVVHFSDIARAYIRERQSEVSLQISSEPQSSGEAGSPHTIIHISHRDEAAAEMGGCGDQPNLRERYGGKGSSLLYVNHLNLPTRDGFILPTSIPRANLHRGDPTWLEAKIEHHLRILENDIERQGGARKRFGDVTEPLVLAVRGGSVFSMPGMLSTIVFVGMNDRIAEALARHGPWRAYDSYRRFLASYAQATWGVDLETFNLVDDAKRKFGVEYKTDLPWEAMQEIAESSKAVLRDHGLSEELETILNDPVKQLLAAVIAVFESWNKERAQRYRDIKGISHSWQTAVIVQEMAFGNGRNEPIRPEMDEILVSLTGVIPRTTVNEFGIRELSGEFKFSAAGDDLVGGVTSSGSFHSFDELDTLMPMLGRRLRHAASKLRRFMGTDQELEFTVENGILSVLQSRTAETYADQAIVKFVEPGAPATRGLGVRGGGFRGVVAFDDGDREEMIATDFEARDDVDGVLMVLENPTPEEIPMIISADGLLTAKGGSTSHAAVAANGIEDKNFCAVMSAAGLQVDTEKRQAVIVDADGNVLHLFRKGDILSLHGTSGEVYVGSRPLEKGTETG